MFYLIYTSSAAQFFNQDDLKLLLVKARENNTIRQVTGVLLYKAGQFMQVLEGELLDVQFIYSKIKEDPRHTNVCTIIECDTEERIFPDWSMAFCNFYDEEIAALPGFNDFLITPLKGTELENYQSLRERLLLLFKKQALLGQ